MFFNADIRYINIDYGIQELTYDLNPRRGGHMNSSLSLSTFVCTYVNVSSLFFSEVLQSGRNQETRKTDKSAFSRKKKLFSLKWIKKAPNRTNMEFPQNS